MTENTFPLLDIPLPAAPNAAVTHGRKLKYPLNLLEAGGKCMAVPAALAAKVRVSAINYGIKTGKQFVVRKLPGSSDFGCWRIEDMTAEQHAEAKAKAQAQIEARVAKKAKEVAAAAATVLGSSEPATSTAATTPDDGEDFI